MKLGYVIGPFDGPNAWEIAENVRQAERVGHILVLLGAFPVIPHANTHHFHGTATPGFWYRGTSELLKRCDFAVTVELVGASTAVLEASKGSRDEISWSLHHNMPLFRDIAGLRFYLLGAPAAVPDINVRG